MSLREQLKKALPWPVYITFAMVTAFVLMWQFQLRREMSFQKDRVASEAKRVELEVNETLKQTSRALQRYATRVEYLGTKDEKYLDLDSHAYLEQLPILKRMGLIDENYHVYWSYPHAISKQVEGFDQGKDPRRLAALDEARATQKPSLSKVIELQSGGAGFLLPVPLYPNEKFKGFVYATIEANKLFNSFVSTADFQVDIYEQDKPIFISEVGQPLYQTLAQSRVMNWSQSTWVVKVTPTQRFVNSTQSTWPYFILVFGVIASLMLGGLLQYISKSRKQLIETSERLTRVLNATGEGIWEREFTPNGEVRFIDSQAKKHFGYSEASSPTYADIRSQLLPEDNTKASDALTFHVQNKTPGFAIDFRIRQGADQYRWLRSRGRIIQEPGQTPVLVSTVRDVTEEIEAQERLKNALITAKEATQAKSDFLANMSHEIRTPLNGVIGMTGLLLDSNLDQTQRDYAETVRSSAEILLSLINDILDFSKIEARKLDLENIDFDLDQVTHNMVRLLDFAAKKKTLEITRSFDAGMTNRVFKGDPSRLGQILANLISNAIKFTERGSVRIHMSHNTDGHLKFEVIDTGIGMNQGALARMFQPFSQADSSTSRRFGGTGLGLSICKHLCEMMGGQIGVTSQEGIGSTFWFTVNLQKGVQTQVLMKGTSKKTFDKETAGKFRILLAEDQQVNQLIAVKMLNKYGFRVDVVANGFEAIDAIKSIPYDLILMDCQMPGLDGYEATRKIRQMEDPKLNRISIIAMTANAMSGDREKCMLAGMNSYVSKPVKPDDLVKAIEQILAEKSPVEIKKTSVA